MHLESVLGVRPHLNIHLLLLTLTPLHDHDTLIVCSLLSHQELLHLFLCHLLSWKLCLALLMDNLLRWMADLDELTLGIDRAGDSARNLLILLSDNILRRMVWLRHAACVGYCNICMIVRLRLVCRVHVLIICTQLNYIFSFLKARPDFIIIDCACLIG